jgi:hypothetical protein
MRRRTGASARKRYACSFNTRHWWSQILIMLADGNLPGVLEETRQP